MNNNYYDKEFQLKKMMVEHNYCMCGQTLHSAFTTRGRLGTVVAYISSSVILSLS